MGEPTYGKVEVFEEGAALTFAKSGEESCFDLSFKADFTVCAYYRIGGVEKFIHEGTLIENVPRETWAELRSLISPKLEPTK